MQARLVALASFCAAAVVVVVLVTARGPHDDAGTRRLVSQAGREFQPNDMTIKRGETLEVVNDDGDLLHHAYIESDRLKFDSGDQKPGSRTSITFPTEGDFDVLCAIHPKMKLVVHVQ